jgi:hypothetical protein
MINFKDWLKLRESNEISKGGWSKRTIVPVGAAKDHQPDHPKNAVDPEPNPKKHRGKIHIHQGHDQSPGHPKNAVDPHKGKRK